MKPIPLNWGFCMGGNEETFCKMLDLAREANKDELFVYYEIGIGHGDTLLAINEYISETPRMMVGVDVPAWSPPKDKEISKDINLLTMGSQAFLSAEDTPKANFIFIDGCHGSPCVKMDFLLAEQKIKPGGIIAFHDADTMCQGRHFQEHCGMGIDVRNALTDLGLLDNTRKGWWKVAETMEDSYRGGHGCVFVQYQG